MVSLLVVLTSVTSRIATLAQTQIVVQCSPVPALARLILIVSLAPINVAGKKSALRASP